MLGPFDYIIWLVGLLLQAYVVLRAVLEKEFVRYFTLNFYMLAAALVTIGQFVVIHEHGFASLEYRYYYYYTDSVLTVFLYFAVLGLYQHVFDEMAVSRYIRIAAVLLLASTACFSYMVVHGHKDHLTSRFVVQLAQNLYFIGVVLSYLLWGAVLKLREMPTRIAQLVLSLGIYFTAYAATYALRNLFPGLQILKAIPPLLGFWLPLAWTYTFTKFPEEARLVTARLAATHR